MSNAASSISAEAFPSSSEIPSPEILGYFQKKLQADFPLLTGKIVESDIEIRDDIWMLKKGAIETLSSAYQKCLEQRNVIITHTISQIPEKIAMLEAQIKQLPRADKEAHDTAVVERKKLQSLKVHGEHNKARVRGQIEACTGIIDEYEKTKKPISEKRHTIQELNREQTSLQHEQEKLGNISTVVDLFAAELRKISAKKIIPDATSQQDKKPVTLRQSDIIKEHRRGFRFGAVATLAAALVGGGIVYKLNKGEEKHPESVNARAKLSEVLGNTLPIPAITQKEREAAIDKMYLSAKSSAYNQLQMDGSIPGFKTKLEGEIKKFFGDTINTVSISEEKNALGEPIFRTVILLKDGMELSDTVEMKNPTEQYLVNLIIRDDVREEIFQALNSFTSPIQQNSLNNSLRRILFKTTLERTQNKGYIIDYDACTIKIDPDTGKPYVQISYAFDGSTNRIEFSVAIRQRTHIPEVDEWLKNDGVGKLTPEQYEESEEKIKLVKKYPKLIEKYSGNKILSVTLTDLLWQVPDSIRAYPHIHKKIAADWGKMCGENTEKIMNLYFQGQEVFQKGIVDLFIQYHPSASLATREELWSHLDYEEMLKMEPSKRGIPLQVCLRTKNGPPFADTIIGTSNTYLDHVFGSTVRDIQRDITNRSGLFKVLNEKIPPLDKQFTLQREITARLRKGACFPLGGRGTIDFDGSELTGQQDTLLSIQIVTIYTGPDGEEKRCSISFKLD